jgi:hypothetical protein
MWKLTTLNVVASFRAVFIGFECEFKFEFELFPLISSARAGAVTGVGTEAGAVSPNISSFRALLREPNTFLSSHISTYLSSSEI